MTLQTRHCETLIALASTTYAQNSTHTSPGYTAPSGYSGVPSGGIIVGGYGTLIFDWTVANIGGATHTVTVTIDRYGQDTNWYNIYTKAVTANGANSTTIGPGCETNHDFGQFIRVQIVVSNGAADTADVAMSLVGKS